MRHHSGWILSQSRWVGTIPLLDWSGLMRNWMRLFIFRRLPVKGRWRIILRVSLKLSLYLIPNRLKIYPRISDQTIAPIAASSNQSEASLQETSWPHPSTTTSSQTEQYNPLPSSTSNTTTRSSPWPKNPSPITNHPLKKPISTHSVYKPPRYPSRSRFPSRPTAITRRKTPVPHKNAQKKPQCSQLRFPNFRVGYQR